MKRILQSLTGGVPPEANGVDNPLATLKQFGFVAEAWYRKRYGASVGHLAAEEHYLVAGASQGFDPNPLFRSQWYLSRYKSAAESGLNPAVHYLLVGSRGGLRPNAFFDPGWYRKTYPDVVAAGMEPLVHYLRFGAIEGRNPAPEVFTSWLPRAIDSVTGGEANPLATYLDLIEKMLSAARETPLGVASQMDPRE